MECKTFAICACTIFWWTTKKMCADYIAYERITINCLISYAYAKARLKAHKTPEKKVFCFSIFFLFMQFYILLGWKQKKKKIEKQNTAPWSSPPTIIINDHRYFCRIKAYTKYFLCAGTSHHIKINLFQHNNCNPFCLRILHDFMVDRNIRFNFWKIKK